MHRNTILFRPLTRRWRCFGQPLAFSQTPLQLTDALADENRNLRVGSQGSEVLFTPNTKCAAHTVGGVAAKYEKGPLFVSTNSCDGRARLLNFLLHPDVKVLFGDELIAVHPR